MITNKMKVVQLKMREARFWPKMKFETIFFQGSLAVFQSKRVASAGGRNSPQTPLPPALQILDEISSNFFERTPPLPRHGSASAEYGLLKRTQVKLNLYEQKNNTFNISGRNGK
jgi:hypothetical protein